MFSCLVLNSTDVIVNIPNLQLVGQSLILECNITSVTYITSGVDIIWNQKNFEIQRTEGVNVSYTNSNKAVYLNTYNISQLSTSDNGMDYNCKVIINQNSPLIAIGTGTLSVTGKYTCMYFTILLLMYNSFQSLSL